MARTNIVIDDKLLARAMQISGAKTKREAVEIALRRFVERRTLYDALRKLRGKLPWKGDIQSWRSDRK